MILFATKVVSILIILLISLLAGLLPIMVKINERNKLFFAYGESFASGVFLGAALLHMLPDAEHRLHNILGPTHYPYTTLLCAVAFILLLFVERVAIFMANKNTFESKRLIAYILVLVLSLHSVIAGAALGINTTISGTFIIFFAIIAHKGSEAFALAMQLKRGELVLQRMKNLVIVFSLMTPIGILLGTSITPLLQTEFSKLTEAGFTAIAAGTFLYIATTHSIDKAFVEDNIKPLNAFFSLATGLALTAIIAIYV